MNDYPSAQVRSRPKEKLRVVAYRNLVRNVCHPRQSCRRDRMVLVIAVHEPWYKLVLVNGPIFFGNNFDGLLNLETVQGAQLGPK
jgi:hypothetical protein